MQRRALIAAAAAAAFTFPAKARASSPLPPALFVLAHPDDEALTTGVSIVKHVAAGQDVHVLLMTDGEKTGVTAMLNGLALSDWWGVPHIPSAEGYATLSAGDVADARLRELANSIDALSSGLPGTLTLHSAYLPDGGVTTADAQLAILSICNGIAPGGAVRLKGHTYVQQLDGHPDHIAVGEALKNLSAYDPARFGDRRHYIEPINWTSPSLSLVAHAWDNATDAGTRARAINACRAYGAWAPAEGMFAIGMHSVPDWFATVIANPRSMYHS